MDATRPSRTRDRARQRWYASQRQRRFARFMGVVAPDRAVGFTIHVYVDDVDNVFRQAVHAGATETMPVADQFWGDRYGKVLDPFGFSWSLATHVRDMTPEEMEAAQEEAMKAMAEKMAEKTTEKAVEPPAAKAPEKTADKTPEKADEKAPAPVPEAPKAEIKVTKAGK